MSIFDKIGKRKICTTTPQVRPIHSFEAGNPFSVSVFQPELYKSLRESIPVIDTAIYKLVRMTGGFKVHANNERNQKELDDFVKNINSGVAGKGLQQFIDLYFEQLLTFGTAAGEIVTDGYSINSLYNIPIKDISLKRNPKNFNEILLCKPDAFDGTPVPYQELVMHSTLNCEPDCLTGNSILKSLPFVSSILMKIYNSIGQNWERAGNLRFAVTYNPGSDMLDRAYAKERAQQIATEWSSAMESGSIKDFVAVGDVQIKVIGADNQILNSEIPVKQMLEQIVAKLSVPPFMLGLSWSTTERMSSQQADALTTEIEAYRRILTPVIEKICSLFLRLQGNSSGACVVWDDVTLQDAVELARANLYNAQAQSLISGGESND